MGKLNGVDISGWQEGIDTRDLTADFVIIKTTEGVQGTIYNPTYGKMADGVLDSGALLGFYHYANGGDPVAEADCFYDSIKAYRGRAAYALDWEEQGNRTFQTGKDASWCKAFMDRIDELMGGVCLIYMDKGTANHEDWSTCAGHPLWGAEYAYNDRTYQGYQTNPWESQFKWGAWGHDVAIHQYGFVNPKPRNGGCDSLDADLMYGTREDWLRWCGEGSKDVGKIDPANVAALIHYDMVTDPRCGYSQAPERWGGDHPDGAKVLDIDGRRYTYPLGSYDCSSSVITAWRQALRYTVYEGALDRATYTGDMRYVFEHSTLFEAKYSPAKRGDLYLNEGAHVAMCQDGGSDGVMGYDCLSEFNRNEFRGATNGQVGDQDGEESVVRGYYDDGWNTVLHYVGGLLDDVSGKHEEDDSTIGGLEMECLLQAPKGDKVYYFNGERAKHIGPDQLKGLQAVWKGQGKTLKVVELPQTQIDALTRL